MNPLDDNKPITGSLFFMRIPRWIELLAFALIFYWIFGIDGALEAQTHRTTRIDGTVVDAQTGEKLPYVNIVFAENSGAGTTTNRHGAFSIISPEGYRTLIVSYIGYTTDTIHLAAGEIKRDYTIRLKSESVGLADVVVRPRKRSYKRKGNPAVELILRAVANRDRNRLEAAGNYSYSVYERIIFARDKYNSHNGFLGLDTATCRMLTDSSTFGTTNTLPVSLREKIEYISKVAGSAERSRIIAQRLRGIDERIDEGPLTNNIQEIFRPIDVYKADVPILLKRIPSPLHPSFATHFYKYFIQDTVMIGSSRCIELSFVPFESHSAGFTGRIWLTMQEQAVRRIELNLPIAANVNWVERLRIEQEFEQQAIYGQTDSLGQPPRLWVPSRQDVRVLISMKDLYIPAAVDAWQTRVFTDYRLGEAAQPLPPVKRHEDNYHPPHRSDLYWTAMRPVPLPSAGHKVETLMEKLNRDKQYRRIALVAQTIATGYFSLPPTVQDSTRPVFDLGPIETFLSGNVIEGFRPRIGGMTTAHLMQHFFADAYVAYGTKDRQWKYRLNMTYTPYRKAYHPMEYPRNNLSVTLQRDLYTVGQTTDPVYRDALLSLLGTIRNTKRQYVDEYLISYIRDWTRSFSSSITIGHHRYQPAGSLAYHGYQSEGILAPIYSYRLTDATVRLRWMPQRVIYNGRKGERAKFNLSRRGPAFDLVHRMAYAGVLGSDYSLQRTDLSYEQQLWLSLFGRIDLQAFGGMVWNTAPHPILHIPIVNESYTLRENTFQLMKPSEYIADRWMGLHATYHLNGLLLDRIPLVRSLGVREIVSGHILWGDLSAKNRDIHRREGVFAFPDDVAPMHHTWYAEGSIGLENIFKILRVEYFYRFTQRQKVDAPRWGLRFLIALRF